MKIFNYIIPVLLSSTALYAQQENDSITYADTTAVSADTVINADSVVLEEILDSTLVESDSTWMGEPYDNSGKPKAYFRNYDSSSVTIRSFDDKKLKQLREDPELSYGYSKASMTMWDVFLGWLSRRLGDMIYEGNGNSPWFERFVYIFCVVVLIYVIIRLLKLNTFRILYGNNNRRSQDYLIIDENIHEMDFEKLLSDAIRVNDHRLAIRLFFLYGLKLLADKQHIYWEPGKTNHDYLNELKTGELRKDFNQLNYYFEYAWYGNFAITADLFTKVNDLFMNWKTKI